MSFLPYVRTARHRRHNTQRRGRARQFICATTRNASVPPPGAGWVLLKTSTGSAIWGRWVYELTGTENIVILWPEGSA
jgi:hypothetical protein